MLDGFTVGNIRAEAKKSWRRLCNKYGPIGAPWTSVSPTHQMEYWLDIEAKYPILRFCDNHYKANSIAISDYSHWHSSRYPDDTPKDEAPKDEPPEDDAPKDGTCKRSRAPSATLTHKVHHLGLRSAREPQPQSADEDEDIDDSPPSFPTPSPPPPRHDPQPELPRTRETVSASSSSPDPPSDTPPSSVPPRTELTPRSTATESSKTPGPPAQSVNQATTAMTRGCDTEVLVVRFFLIFPSHITNNVPSSPRPSRTHCTSPHINTRLR